MLAAYLVWRLRKALAPSPSPDGTPPVRVNPVAATVASSRARTKTTRKHNVNSDGMRGFRELGHLGTPTRNTVKVTAGTTNEFDMLTTPTSVQRHVFELPGASVPLWLM